MPTSEKTVISLFAGALGLDLGLEKAGFKIRVAVECNKFAAETIRRNRPDIPVIARKIEDVTTAEILEVAGLAPGEATVVTGGPSCQPFSTAGRRGSVNDPRGVLFHEFCRVVNEAQPQFFVMENVKGVLSAAIRHRPLKERGPGYPHLEPEEELGSALIILIEELKKLGYYTIFDVLNAADFGVPQSRERVIFIGSRDGQAVTMPEATHAKESGNNREQWRTLQDALKDLEDHKPEYSPLSPGKAQFIGMIPPGGNWRSLPHEFQESALGGAHISWGGRVGFFRRLAWEKTSPALTTRPDSKATMLCHPSEDRPLSVREYGRIQQFPDHWDFAGGTPQKYIQIGNAFPVGLGTAVGKALLDIASKQGTPSLCGVVACPSKSLLSSLAHGNRTTLNPIRMREIKDPNQAKEWLRSDQGRKKRSEILDHVVLAGEPRLTSELLTSSDNAQRT